MTWVRCPACGARRPESMPQCPVCARRAGASPRFDESERRARAAWNRFNSLTFFVEAAIAGLAALITWLVGGCG